MPAVNIYINSVPWEESLKIIRNRRKVILELHLGKDFGVVSLLSRSEKMILDATDLVYTTWIRSMAQMQETAECISLTIWFFSPLSSWGPRASASTHPPPSSHTKVRGWSQVNSWPWAPYSRWELHLQPLRAVLLHVVSAAVSCSRQG